MTVVEYPNMRCDVLDSLAVLSDTEYQRRAWIERQGFKAGGFDNFDYHIDVLYDDTEVLPNPEDSLGTVLLPGDEIERLRAVGAILDQLLDRHGDAGDEVFISDTQWPSVVSAASVALAAMIRAGGLRVVL
ncbi:SCO4402 family protein [Kribbella sp. CA-293567]|uniref:SCO4402 family protein n=1 Tax=Kribbella sp. CA-293567 TaxID=3002436 RepID=UPI0022DE592B|nr:hypothetical protein [Kribbella sp. CA-293567]WBQ04093.1 hypothetical protein OX958_29515 [Kribbella sp. CA-293567]